MNNCISAAILVGLLLPGVAMAQSFDCAKARSPQEKAICREPGLAALDRSLADTFAAAVARSGDGGTALRAAEGAWVRERDTRCKAPAGLAACLADAMTRRIAALAPPAGTGTRQAATPASPTPGPVAVPAVPVAVPSAFNPPPGEATLERTSLPAGGPGDTMLRVRVPGRFVVAARSASGTALQLVDMMAGPMPVAGEAGVRDGRTDVLLDSGTYKLRVMPAENATGEVGLSVEPFRDAQPPAALPGADELRQGSLGDRQQLSFWAVVGPDGRVEVDAAGRALADLRLWRGGSDLEPMLPGSTVVEPAKGHPMLRLRLSGKVEPGTYLVTAYGGPALGWADGAADTPFLVRSGLSPRLREGWASGTVGPMGSEVFEAPARAGQFRLSLPAPAAARLSVDGQAAGIAANSRDPVASVGTGPNRRVVEVTGLAGQAFRLRAFESSAVKAVTRPGRYMVTAPVIGAGGDEVPPTVMLLLDRGKGTSEVLASTAPRVGPQAPWRAQFNVRGPTTVLLQNTASGEVMVRNASQNLATLHWQPHAANLPADFAEYLVAPPEGRQGVVDLVFGGAANGATPAATVRWPADPAVPLGVQVLAAGAALWLDSNDGPALQAGLVARPAPVALVEGPLALSQMPGVGLEVPVRVAAGGTLAVVDPDKGVDVPVTVRAGPDGATIVPIPAPDAPRNLVLAWRGNAVRTAARTSIPAPPRRVDVPTITAGTPQFLDLGRGETRRFDLLVPTGGLFRVETLGRLHTGLELGTAFNPQLEKAEANGVAANALMLRSLRAGRYRVAVRVSESAGHLGLTASPAPTTEGAPLVPGGVVRATMAAGTGLSVPVTVARDGRYRLELLGPGGAFQARLEDADGWPLTAPGELDTLEQRFRPGTYRLLVSPLAVAAPLAVRLTEIVAPVAPEGHGPHALTPGEAVSSVWREPAGRDDARTPDEWQFTLAGPADATVRISAGMVAQVERDGTTGPVARVLGPAPARLSLAAGRYHLRATSLGRNDRLPYTLTLSTAELQPGAPRRVKVDAQVPFSLAEPRVVSLTSWGKAPVRATLREMTDADGVGRVLGRYGAADGGDGWNLAVSRALPAGRYRLDLQPGTPPDMAAVTGPATPPAAADPVPAAPATPDDATPPADDTDTADAPAAATPAAASDEPTPQTPPGAAADGSGDEATADSVSADGGDDEPAAKKVPSVELTLALPTMRDAVAAPEGTVALAEGGVHRLTLPPVRDGQLAVATAQGEVALVLSLQRRGGDGGWAEVARDVGLAPVVALDGAAAGGGWQVAVWPVDGGALPMKASVSVLDGAAQGLGAVTLRPVTGAAVPVFVAAVGSDGRGPVSVSPGAGVMAGGWPGHALTPLAGGLAMPQGGPVWLLARAAEALTTARVVASPGQPTTLAVPAGAIAELTAPAPGAGLVRAWRAESGLGQPGLDAGQGMGVAPGSALAVGTGAVRVWDAGAEAEVLRPRVTPLDLRVEPARTLTDAATLVLPPGSATAVTLPAGARRTDLSLAAGVAAVAGRGAGAVTVWAGDTAEVRSLTGDWTELLLVNAGAAPAPAAVAWTPGVADAALRPGQVSKRFYGASGAFDVAVPAARGMRVVLAGDARAVFVGADGTVRRGQGFSAEGGGRMTVAHAPGPLAVWLEGPGVSPWPAVSARAGAMPGVVTLSGPAMALSLPVPAPVLLHARSTAPVILRLDDGAPVLFAAGASLSRYVAKDVVLHVDSPHDGPLSGTLELTADPVVPVTDGLGPPVALGPGDAVAFAFEVPRATPVGLGVRADPDLVQSRLLAADGRVLGEGAALLQTLTPGRYLLETRLPPDASAATVRVAVVGIAQRPSGPPPDEVRRYLELAGLAPKEASPR